MDKKPLQLPSPTSAFTWAPELWAIVTSHPAYAELTVLYSALRAAEAAEITAKAAARPAVAARDQAKREIDARFDWSEVNALQRRKTEAWAEFYALQRRVKLAQLRIPVDPHEVAPLDAAMQAASAAAQAADAAHKVAYDALRSREQEALREHAGPFVEACEQASEAVNAAHSAVNAAYTAYVDALMASPLRDFIAWP